MSPRSTRAVLTALSIVTISVYAYLILRDVLAGLPKGGDTPHAISLVAFLLKSWPHLPGWNSEWGVGHPFLAFYHPMGIWTTFLAAKISGIPIVELYKLVSFLLVLLSAVGLFAFLRTSKIPEIPALAASLLYLLTPGSYALLFNLGFFTDAFGYVFLWTLLISFRALSDSGKSRFLLLGIGSYFGLLLSHPIAALFGTIFLVTYAFWQIAGEGYGRHLFLDLAKVVLGGLSLSAFWYLPFLVLGAFERFGQVLPTSTVVTAGAFRLDQIMGLATADPFVLSTWSVALATVGAVISENKFRRFALPWTIVLLFLLLAPLAGLVSLYWILTPVRFLPWTSMFLAMLGGLGLSALFDHFARIVKIDLQSYRSHIAGVLLVAVLLSPAIANASTISGLATDHGPDFALAKELSRIIPTGGQRIALAPAFGGVIETLNIFSDASQLWNYQQQSAPNLGWIAPTYGYLFLGRGSAPQIQALSEWFGLDYVLLEDNPNSLNRYVNTTFTVEWRGHNAVLLRNERPTGIVTVAEAWNTLVIGERAGFGNVFWSFIVGGFGPSSTYFVTRGGNVDDYGVEELLRFRSVILYGYRYSDRTKAWKTLEEYVRAGGTLLIDTGFSPDSDSPDLPLPFPISRTKATDFGKSWTFSVLRDPITDGLDFQRFSPALYGENPWGVSSSFNETVRAWARPVAWISGQPIIVSGEFGNGRVVWSGLNLPFHIVSFENTEEARLLSAMNTAGSKVAKEKLGEFSIKRDSPDKIVVAVLSAQGPLGVLFRETFFPKWQTRLESKGASSPLELYQAGPWLMYTILDSKAALPGTLVFEYARLGIEWIGLGISLGTLLGIAAATGASYLRRTRPQIARSRDARDGE